jgi:hypothetical protein
MTVHLQLDRSQMTRGQWTLLNSTEKNVLLAGGFGSGKTVGLGLKLLQLKSDNPGVPGLLLAQSWRALWSITYRRLMAVVKRSLPREAWPKIIDRSGECYLDFGDGVPVFLRSAHDPATFDGLDVGWALGDEARHWPRVSHETLLGRVRIKCARPQIAYASTPAMNWLSDEFNSGVEKRQLIRAPTKENLKNLAPDYIENLRLSYSRRLQQAVVDGLFVTLEGAVYEQVDTANLSSPWFVDYDWRDHRDRKTILAVDPGFRRSAWIWVQEETPTSWVVVHEMMPDDTSDDACVQMVNDSGLPVDEIWCDPAADQTQSTFSLDTITMMREIESRSNAPIRYVTGPFRSITYGVDKLRTLFGDPEIHQPVRIRFSKSLVQLEKHWKRGVVKDTGAYRYRDDKEGRAVRDEPNKDGVTDHSMDAVRNLAVGLWLTSPLRNVDSKLRKLEERGYKRAA